MPNNYPLFAAIIINILFIIIGLFSDFRIPFLTFFHISNTVKIGLLIIFSVFGILTYAWTRFLDYIYEDNREETSLMTDY
jgi:hypothetical protein